MIIYTFKKGAEPEVDLRTFPDGGNTFSVHVDGSSGLIGKPAMKSVVNFDWQYLNGSVPDLRNRRYENKEIALSCWVTAASKQKLVETVNKFLYYFNYDDYLLMKVTWDNTDGHHNIIPNPHASKGIYSLVWLDSVSPVRYRFRFGKQYARFELLFKDPYPVKRIYQYSGTASDGVDYDIVSETEIDIYTEDGQQIRDILTGTGHIDCGFTKILVCGDVTHATDSQGGNAIVKPTNTSEDIVTLLYSEI